MDALFPWRRSKTTTELNDLDSYLHTTLSPVLPNSEFVENLQRRLTSEAFGFESAGRPGPFRFVMVIAGMMLSMSLVLITGLRIIATLAGVFGRVYTSLQRTRRNRLAARPINPVEAGP